MKHWQHVPHSSEPIANETIPGSASAVLASAAGAKRQPEVAPARSPLVRYLLLVFGSVSLALGVIGIVVPLLPTTPFLLLTAACYARSSDRFYRWLLGNRWFGSYIADWRAGRGIPRRAKIAAIASLVLGLGSSIVFFVPRWPLKLAVGCVGVLVGIHILRLPTRGP